MGRRIINHYGTARATEAVADFAAAVELFEAATTSLPQRRLIEVEHGKLASRLTQLGAEIARESRETTRLLADYDIYLQAAHLLAADLERAMNGKPAEAGESALQIEASLAKLVGRLEELKPEIDREVSDDSDSVAWHAALVSAEQTLATKLLDAAPSSAQSPRNRDGDVQRAAAFAGSVSAMSVTIDTMIEQSASRQAQTGPLTLDAGLLRLEQLWTDPNIGAAIDRVRRGSRDDARDLTARLTALGSGLGSGSKRTGLSAAE